MIQHVDQLRWPAERTNSNGTMKINKVKASSVNLDTNALEPSPWENL